MEQALLSSSSTGTLWQFPRRGLAPLRADRRRLRSPRRSRGRAPYNPDKSKEHRPVDNGCHHQENDIGELSQP